MIDLARLIALAVDLFANPAKSNGKRKTANLPKFEHGIVGNGEKCGSKRSKPVFLILASFAFAMAYIGIHPMYSITFMVIGFSAERGWKAFLLALEKWERRRDHEHAVENFRLLVDKYLELIEYQKRLIEESEEGGGCASESDETV